MNPKRFLIGTAVYIAIPSIINAVHNHGDERVREVPRAQRDMFWIVPVGEGENTALIRIPKPFESGVLFGSAVERATEFLLDVYTDKYKGDIGKARQRPSGGLALPCGMSPSRPSSPMRRSPSLKPLPTAL